MPRPPDILQDAPQSLRVSVAYFDSNHEELMKAPPYPKTLQSIAGHTIVIPTADLLAYYLFWKQRARPDLYSSLKRVRASNLFEAVGELANLITLRHGSIHTEANVDEGPTSVTGRLGEAVGLSVLNRIHKTTTLDWVALPERKGLPKGHKPMDYRNTFGSDGSKTVQIECKGSFLDGNVKAQSGKINKHAVEIATKKETLDALPQDTSPIWKADVRYGTITTFEKEGGGDAHCWLLDPPEDGGGSAEDSQTIARLLNVTHWLRLIAPRSYLSTALINRTAAITSAVALTDSEGVPLMRGSGRSFEDQFGSVTAVGSSSSRFFAYRSTVEDYPAGGAVFSSNDGQLLFVGLREDLLKHVVYQDFGALREYENTPTVMTATINAVVPRGEAESMDLDEDEENETAGPYIRKKLKGCLFATSGGLVFGFLSS